MDAFLIAIVTALVAMAIWEFARISLSVQRNRRGPLAGNWYQVTYAPEDDSRIWSIEWVEVRHSNIAVHGTMWRIYASRQPLNLHHRWKFHGWHQDSFTIGAYLGSRGDGKDGVMLLRGGRGSGCIGRFMQALPHNLDFGLEHRGFSANFEWIRLGGAAESLVLEKVESSPKGELEKSLPRRINKRLRRQIEGVSSRETYRSLTFGSAVSAFYGPLATEEDDQEGG